MQNPQVLIIAHDPTLREEVEAAMRGIKRWKPILHEAIDERTGVELARNRRPEIVLVEMQPDVRALKDFAEEVSAAAPESIVVATYRREMFGPNVDEGAVFIEAMRAKVGDFLQRPLSTSELQQLFDRVLHRRTREHHKLGKVISFVSNKGGAGKSTISVSTAVALAQRHPDQVLLIDTSLQLGVAALMLDVAPKTTIVDAIRESHRLDETLLRQIATKSEWGLDVLAAPPDAVEASHVDDEGLSRIVSLARRTYDYVVIDTYPMLDSVIMAALDVSDLVYVVFHATVPSVVGNAHFLDVLRKVGVSPVRQRVALNYNFPKVSGSLRVADVVERLGRDVDHVFPYQKRLLTALNTGRPYAAHCGRRFGFGKALHGVVREIEEIPEVGGRGSTEAPPPLRFPAERSYSEVV